MNYLRSSKQFLYQQRKFKLHFSSPFRCLQFFSLERVSWNPQDLGKNIMFRSVTLSIPWHSALIISQFLLSLGDIKPESLWQLESLIWKHLLQVARCKISPTDMVNIILEKRELANAPGSSLSLESSPVTSPCSSSLSGSSRNKGIVMVWRGCLRRWGILGLRGRNVVLREGMLMGERKEEISKNRGQPFKKL